MHKKLMLACMAIAAFAAFVIPSAASATTLTENGKAITVGTSITATNVGVTKFEGGTALIVECDHDHLSGTLTENNTTHVVGEIPVGSAKFNGTGTNTDCTSNIGSTKVTVTSKICITAGASDVMTVTGCGGNVVFDLEVTGTGNCKYSVASITGTYTTNSTPAEGTITKQGAPRIEGGVFCPAEGKLTMTFALYTTGGTEGLTIS